MNKDKVYICCEELVQRFEEMFGGNTNAAPYVNSLKYLVMEMSVPKAEWVFEQEETERGTITSYHCSACERCYYINKPKARYCPQCGMPISGGEELEDKEEEKE